MNIKILEDKDYEKYEIFLLSFDESLLYYSVKYKKLLEELLGCKSHYILVNDDKDNIKAILPIMKKDGKYGTILNSLPFYGSNGAILSKSKEAYDFLLNYYNELTKTVSGATYIENPLLHNIEELDNDIVDVRIGQWTSISYTEQIAENILNSFKSGVRRNVRKAMKSNIKVEIDNNQFEFLYNTHYENITSIGGKAKDKNFFALVEKYFEKEKDYNIYIATLDGQKLGAVLLFYYNKTVEYFTPAVILEYRNYQPTSLLIYKAMCDASRGNYKWWNWGGTWLTQDGVYHFKKRFGAVDKEYKYFIKINNQDIYNATKEELLKVYSDFYVIPFNKLESKR